VFLSGKASPGPQLANRTSGSATRPSPTIRTCPGKCGARSTWLKSGAAPTWRSRRRACPTSSRPRSAMSGGRSRSSRDAGLSDSVLSKVSLPRCVSAVPPCATRARLPCARPEDRRGRSHSGIRISRFAIRKSRLTPERCYLPVPSAATNFSIDTRLLAAQN
jgi:hypothetical protein